MIWKMLNDGYLTAALLAIAKSQKQSQIDKQLSSYYATNVRLRYY